MMISECSADIEEISRTIDMKMSEHTTKNDEKTFDVVLEICSFHTSFLPTLLKAVTQQILGRSFFQ